MNATSRDWPGLPRYCVSIPYWDERGYKMQDCPSACLEVAGESLGLAMAREGDTLSGLLLWTVFVRQ